MDEADVVVITTNCALCLFLGALDFFMTFMTDNAKVRKAINFHFVIVMSINVVILMVWVKTKPNCEEQETTGSTIHCKTNSTYFYIDPNQKYCMNMRYAKEYFLSLTGHWILCGLIKLYISITEVLTVFRINKKMYIIFGYCLLIFPVWYYIQETTCNLSSCWNYRKFSLDMMLRPIILYTIGCAFTLIFVRVSIYYQKPIATSGPKRGYKKTLFFFVTMGTLIALMITLHVISLNTTLMTMEVYESYFALTASIMHLIWIIYSTWQLKVLSSIMACVQSLFNKPESHELRDMPVAARWRSARRERLAIRNIV